MRDAPISGKRYVTLQKNPYDGYMVLGGIYCPIELKSIKAAGTFPLAHIQPHQIEGMGATLHHGACPFLAINFRKKIGKEGKLVSGNRAFILPMSRYSDLVDECRASGRVSVPWQWFEGGNGYFSEIPRLPKYQEQPPVWDLYTGLTLAARIANNDAYRPLEIVLETDFYATRSRERIVGVAR